VSVPPGVAQERTALSWQRTGLGVLAVAGLLGHRAVRQGDPVTVVVSGVVALLGLAVLGALAPLRYRQVRRRVGAGSSPVAGGAAAGVTAAVVVASVAALVSVLAPG
jgi:putative membrane protein